MSAKEILAQAAEKIGNIVQDSPIKDVEKNAKTAFSSALSRLDMVTREEFDIQQRMIEHLCNEISRLQDEINQLKNN